MNSFCCIKPLLFSVSVSFCVFDMISKHLHSDVHPWIQTWKMLPVVWLLPCCALHCSQEGVFSSCETFLLYVCLRVCLYLCLPPRLTTSRLVTVCQLFKKYQTHTVCFRALSEAQLERWSTDTHTHTMNGASEPQCSLVVDRQRLLLHMMLFRPHAAEWHADSLSHNINASQDRYSLYDTHSLRHALKNPTRPICPPPEIQDIHILLSTSENPIHFLNCSCWTHTIVYCCIVVYCHTIGWIGSYINILKARQNCQTATPTCNK